jgi:hypothetical protein
VTLFFYYGTGDLGNTAVRLGSGFTFTEAADSGTYAMSRVRVDDVAGALNIVGHHDFRVAETACTSWPTLFKGYFADRNVARADSLILGAERIWDGTVYDLNAALQFEIFRGSSSNRPAETDTARLAWALGSGFTGPISTNGDAVFGAGVNLDKQDYRGMTLADVLSDCAQVSGNNYFVAWDQTIFAPRLHYYDPSRAYNDCSLKISNVASDVDGSTVYAPSRDTKLNRDPSRVYSGVYYRYGDGSQSVYRTDAGVEAAIGHKRETSWTDVTLSSSAKADGKADKWLAEAALELDKITTSLFKVPRALVNLFRAGQRIQVKFTHLPGYSSYTYVRITRRTVQQDGATQDFYRLDLELTNYPKQGGSKVRHPAPNGDNPNVPSAPILNAPASTSVQSTSATTPWVELSPLGASLVFANGAGWGAENVAWPFTPCGVGAGAWRNPFPAGGYYAFTAPANVGQVGAKLPAFGPNATHGNAVGWNAYVFVGTTVPYSEDPAFYGTPVTDLLQGDQDVLIPGGLIPWGADFCIVVFPAWAVDTGGYVCAIAGGQRPEQTAQLGCGEFSGFPASLSIEYIGIDSGTAGWIDAGPFESPDGTLQTFTLVGWDGTDLPVIHRNGVKVDLASTDPTAGTVTLTETPQSGDNMTARYHVGDVPV